MRFSPLLSTCLAGACALAMFGCDVDVEDSGKLPEVNVEPGRAPDVDVHGPDVDIGTKEETVEVPDIDVDVGTKKKQVTLPDVDVDVPAENEN